MRPLTAAVLGKAVVTFVLGLAVGAVGTVMHRWHEPWGVLACLALVVSAVVTSRAWAGWPTWIAAVGGVFFAVQAMSQTGPGGDVLLPAGQAIGWVWVIGSIGLALVTGLLPARLFRDEPRGRRGAPVPGPALPAAEEPSRPGAGEPGR